MGIEDLSVAIEDGGERGELGSVRTTAAGDLGRSVLRSIAIQERMQHALTLGRTVLSLTGEVVTDAHLVTADAAAGTEGDSDAS